jgi:hypothetical protein
MYKKKPIKIEAIQFTGHNQKEILSFGDGSIKNIGSILYINTLEGKLTISEGDYVIKGIKGEIYPCKPDIFLASYDPVCE